MPQSPQRKWQRLRMLITPPPIYLPCTYTRLLNLPPEVLQRILSFIVRSPTTFQARDVFTGRSLQDVMDAYQLCSMHPELKQAFTEPAARVISQYSSDASDPSSMSVCTPQNHAFIALLIRASAEVLEELILHPSSEPECLKFLDSCPNLVSLSFRDSCLLPQQYLERCLPKLQSLCVSEIRSSTLSLVSRKCKQLQHFSVLSSPVVSLGVDRFQCLTKLRSLTIYLHHGCFWGSSSCLGDWFKSLLPLRSIEKMTLICDSASSFKGLMDAHRLSTHLGLPPPSPTFKHLIVKCPAFSFCTKRRPNMVWSSAAIRVSDICSTFSPFRVFEDNEYVFCDSCGSYMLIERRCVDSYHLSRIRSQLLVRAFFQRLYQQQETITTLSCYVDDASENVTETRWERDEANRACHVVREVLSEGRGEIREIRINRGLLIDADLTEVQSMIRVWATTGIEVVVLRISKLNPSNNVRFLHRLPSILQFLHGCTHLRRVAMEDSGGVADGYMVGIGCEKGLEELGKLQIALPQVEVCDVRGMVERWWKDCKDEE